MPVEVCLRFPHRHPFSNRQRILPPIPPFLSRYGLRRAFGHSPANVLIRYSLARSYVIRHESVCSKNIFRLFSISCGFNHDVCYLYLRYGAWSSQRVGSTSEDEFGASMRRASCGRCCDVIPVASTTAGNQSGRASILRVVCTQPVLKTPVSGCTSVVPAVETYGNLVALLCRGPVDQSLRFP